MRVTIRETDTDSDSKRIATICGDNIIRVWSTNRCELIQTINHKAMQISFMPGGDRLLSVGFDEVVCIWNIETGQIIRKKKFICKKKSVYFQIRDIAVSQQTGNILLFTSTFVKIFNATLENELLHYDLKTDLMASQFNEASGLYAYVDGDEDEKSSVFLFDLNKAELIKQTKLDSDPSTRMLFSQNADELIFTSSRGIFKTEANGQRMIAAWEVNLIRWDLKEGTTQKKSTFKLGIHEHIKKICWHEDGSAVAVLTSSRLLSLSGFSEQPKTLLTIPKDSSHYNLIYHGAGRQLILHYGEPGTDKANMQNDVYNSKLIRISDDDFKTEALNYGEHPPITGDCDGSLNFIKGIDLFIVRQKFSVELWNTKTWELENRIYQHKSAINIDLDEYFRETGRPFEFSNWLEDVKISPDGKLVGVVGDSTGLSSAQLYHSDGQPFRVLRTSVIARAERIAFSNNSKFVVVDYHSYGLSVLETDSGQLMHLLTDHNIQYTRHDFSQSAHTLKFSPDDTLVAAGFDQGSVWIWNRITGNLDHAICAVGQDDDKLEWQSFDKTPPEQDLYDHELAEIRCLAWRHDGKTLYIGTDSGLYQWDIERNSATRVCSGEIHGLALWNNPEDPEDCRIALFDCDEREIIILGSSLQQIGNIEGAGWGAEEFLAFSNDGTWLQDRSERINWQTGQVIEGENSSGMLDRGMCWDGVSNSVHAVGYDDLDDGTLVHKWTINFPSGD